MQGVERSLGPMERLMWLFDRVCPFNFLVAVELEGDLDADRLQAALAAAQARHPLLRVRIEPRLFRRGRFLSEGVPPLPLSVEDRPRRDRRARLEEELNTPIPTDRGPLARCFLLRHEGGASTLGVTFLHVIGDAKSGIFLVRDLLEAVSGAELSPLAPLPATELLFPRSRRGLRVFFRHLAEVAAVASKGAHMPAVDGRGPLSQRRAIIATGELPEEVVTGLVARSKAEQTTVHGALLSALDQAVLEELERRRPVLVNASPVDLRTRLEPTLGEEVHFLQGFGATPHLLPPEGLPFWELARATRQALVEALDRGQHMTFVPPALRVYGWIGALFGAKVAGWLFHAMSLPAVSLSNIGRAPIPEQVGDHTVRRVGFCSSLTCWSDMTGFASTAGGALRFNLVTMEPTYTRQRAERILSRTISHLEAAV